MWETPAPPASSKERGEGWKTSLSFSKLCTGLPFPRLVSHRLTVRPESRTHSPGSVVQKATSMKTDCENKRVARTRFTKEQIVELRTRRASGESLNSLAKAFNSIPEYVGCIVTGKVHKDAGGPITRPFQVIACERQIELDGVKLSETKWAKRVGLSRPAVATRLYRGWSEKDALTTPLRTAPSDILRFPGPSIAYVALNKGLFACIDVDTIPLVQDRNWYAVKDARSGRMYPATHRFVDGKEEFVSMRTVVLGAKPKTSYALNANNLDCRKANLRNVSKAQSSWRNGKRRDNKTGHTGVFWNVQKQRFIARMQTNGVTEHVGGFKTLEEAVAALERAAIRVRGEYARPNSTMLERDDE